MPVQTAQRAARDRAAHNAPFAPQQDGTTSRVFFPVSRVERWIIAIALVAFAALLLRNGYTMLHFDLVARTYPFDLDYGEGIVWHQAREIVAGRGYAPLGLYPAIVFHYPPVFHVTSMALASLAGIDQLCAGRTVSSVSTFATMALCALPTAAALPAEIGRRVRMATAVAASLLFIDFSPVALWSGFMRVDMLAGALSMAGLVATIHAVRQPRLIVPAAILFVLSIYTKQTSIAAPTAAFLMLLALRPRLACALLALCLMIGLGALAWLSWASHGGFLRHILLYNLNRYDPANVKFLLVVAQDYSVFFGACGIGVVLTVRHLLQVVRSAGTPMEWRRRHGDDVHVAAAIAALLFFILKLVMVPMILKSGASYNYLTEWLSAVAIFAAIGIAPVLIAAFDGKAPAPALLTLAALLLPLQGLHRPRWELTADLARQRVALLTPLVDRIRAADKPVISDMMVLLIRAGKPVEWEPSITAELAHSGRYDDAAFARLVRAHRFAFFVTESDRGNPLFDDRYNPVVADAIDQAYPHEQKVAGLIVHLP